MWKALAAAVISFTMGGAAMTALGAMLGGYAEPAALALAGLGLMASGQLLHTRAPAPDANADVARRAESKVTV